MQPGNARRSSKPLLHLHEKGYEAYNTNLAGLHLTAGICLSSKLNREQLNTMQL